MITATIKEKSKVKGILVETRKVKCYHSLDKARKELAPIAKEMEVARNALKNHQAYKEPAKTIIAVSYDTKSEKNLLLEMRAIVSIDNEEE